MSKLSDHIDLYFRINKLSQRKMAPLMDLNHSTLSRFLNGKDITQDNYNKILRWILS